jgi:hypothetical protein
VIRYAARFGGAVPAFQNEEVDMADPIKCYKLTEDDVKQQSRLAWRIPTKWLLSQAVNCYMEDVTEIVFAVIDDRLFMKGIRQTSEDNLVLPAESWFEEFPPWP